MGKDGTKKKKKDKKDKKKKDKIFVVDMNALGSLDQKPSAGPGPSVFGTAGNVGNEVVGSQADRQADAVENLKMWDQGRTKPVDYSKTGQQKETAASRLSQLRHNGALVASEEKKPKKKPKKQNKTESPQPSSPVPTEETSPQSASPLLQPGDLPDTPEDCQPSEEALPKSAGSARSAPDTEKTEKQSRSPSTKFISGLTTYPPQDLDIVFVEALERRFECPVCCQILRFPVQFEDCGHRCCSACLPELLRTDGRCPLDNESIDRDRVIVDKSFQREIDELEVKCSNHKAGCKWKGCLRDLMPHWEECKYTKIPCPRGCGKEIERRHTQKHIDFDCSKRDVKCEFCREAMTHEEEYDHLNTCPKFPVPCPNGCKEKEIPRERMEQHLEKECTKQKTLCPFSDAGCTFKGERKEIDKHIEKELADHVQKLCNYVMKQKNYLDDTASKLDACSGRITETQARVIKLEKLYGAQIVWRIDNFDEKFQAARQGVKPTIFSPAFLTSRHGYKMALSACLYGDGKMRSKYMSLFACICKGDYDPLLLWPFAHRITFTLIDQCQDPDARRNVVHVVKPNPCKENRPFLGRPVGDRNASFGAQRFVELEVLQSCDYVRDNSIFIKVEVASDDIPLL